MNKKNRNVTVSPRKPPTEPQKYSHFKFWLPTEFADRLEEIRDTLHLPNNIIAFSYCIQYVYDMLMQLQQHQEQAEQDKQNFKQQTVEPTSVKLDVGTKNDTASL